MASTENPTMECKAVADTVIRPAKTLEKEPVPDVSVPGGTVGDGADENGWLPLGFDPGVVDTLATVYGHWTSGLRELYANLVASCKRAKSEYGADPTIVIAIDGRTIRLEDVDSCGMSRRVFEEGIAVAGNTGNDDPRSPGQWGLGSLSFVMMADEMLIESHSRATGERFTVKALRGGRFVTGGLPEPNLGSYGTRMTLEMRGGLDGGEAIKAAVDISEMSGVRTILRVRGARQVCNLGRKWIDVDGIASGLECLEGMDVVEDGPHAMAEEDGMAFMLGGRSLLGRVVHEAGRAGYNMGGRPDRHWNNGCLLGEGGGVVVIHAENGDLGVAAAIGLHERSTGRSWTANDPSRKIRRLPNKTWLAGMPIKSDAPRCLEQFSCVSVNAKNERVYRPTPDRERLTDESEKRLNADVAALVMCEIAKMRFASLGEYLSDYGNRMVEASVHLDDTDAPAGADDLPRETRERMDALPLETRRRLGWAPRDAGDRQAGAGIAGDREMRIARAASAPIKVFGSAKAGDEHTLWSAVRCGGGDGGKTHGAACSMAAGRAQGWKEPVLIVARTLETRKAVAVLDWCRANEAGRTAVVFRPDKENPYGIDEYASLGAERIGEFMARNGIEALSADRARKASGRAVSRTSLVVYGGELRRWHPGYRSIKETEKIDPLAADEHIVWCDNSGDMNAMKSIVAVLPCRTRAAKAGRRPGRATPFAEYAEAGGVATYATTAGRLSGSAIARTGRRIAMVEYDGDAGDLTDLMRTAAARTGSLRGERRERYFDGTYDDGGAETESVEDRRRRKLSQAPMVVAGRGPELAACAAHLHARGARFGVWAPNINRYGSTPEFVSGAKDSPYSYLGDAEPNWIERLSILSRRSGKVRTLIASALHGHLANVYRKGPRGGSGRDGRSN